MLDELDPRISIHYDYATQFLSCELTIKNVQVLHVGKRVPYTGVEKVKLGFRRAANTLLIKKYKLSLSEVLRHSAEKERLTVEFEKLREGETEMQRQARIAEQRKTILNCASLP
jgi:hypothetical protein